MTSELELPKISETPEPPTRTSKSVYIDELQRVYEHVDLLLADLIQEQVERHLRWLGGVCAELNIIEGVSARPDLPKISSLVLDEHVAHAAVAYSKLEGLFRGVVGIQAKDSAARVKAGQYLRKKLFSLETDRLAPEKYLESVHETTHLMEDTLEKVLQETVVESLGEKDPERTDFAFYVVTKSGVFEYYGKLVTEGGMRYLQGEFNMLASDTSIDEFRSSLGEKATKKMRQRKRFEPNAYMISNKILSREPGNDWPIRVLQSGIAEVLSDLYPHAPVLTDLRPVRQYRDLMRLVL